MTLCLPSSVISSYTSFHFTVAFHPKVTVICMFFNSKANKYLSCVYFFILEISFQFACFLLYLAENETDNEGEKNMVFKKG